MAADDDDDADDTTTDTEIEALSERMDLLEQRLDRVFGAWADEDTDTDDTDDE